MDNSWLLIICFNSWHISVRCHAIYILFLEYYLFLITWYLKPISFSTLRSEVLPPENIPASLAYCSKPRMFMLHCDIPTSYSGLDFLSFHLKNESFFARPLDQNCLDPYECRIWHTFSIRNQNLHLLPEILYKFSWYFLMKYLNEKASSQIVLTT